MYTLITNRLYKICMTSECFLPRFYEERALTQNMINKMSPKMRKEASPPRLVDGEEQPGGGG